MAEGGRRKEHWQALYRCFCGSCDASWAAPYTVHTNWAHRTFARVQDNYFFDGPNRELNSRRVVLRLRTYNGDQKATITLKVCVVGAAGMWKRLRGPVKSRQRDAGRRVNGPPCRCLHGRDKGVSSVPPKGFVAALACGYCDASFRLQRGWRNHNIP